MTSSVSDTVVLHADQEHDRLRTTVILLLIFLFFLSYWLVSRLLNLDIFAPVRDYAVSLSCVLGLALALGITAVLEIWLKQIWPSGRSLTLDEEGIQYQSRPENAGQIWWGGGLAFLPWYFSLRGYRRGGREKRLSNRWLCLAYQLQQGDQRLIVYSYMPPQKASAWLNNDNSSPKFHELKPADVYESTFSGRFRPPTRPQIKNEVLTGKDGRFWLAERFRWEEGFELTPQDFAIFMDFIAKEVTLQT